MEEVTRAASNGRSEYATNIRPGVVRLFWSDFCAGSVRLEMMMYAPPDEDSS
jgi:hypothetical protein